MRIGIVTTWFERGAAYVSRQYRDILAPDHRVFLFARGGEEQARDDPHWDEERVTWARSIPTHGGTAFSLNGFRSWVKRRRLDLVLFNEQHWWPPVLLAQDLGLLTAAYVDYYTEETVPLFGNYDLLVCHTRRHQSVFDWHPGSCYLPWGTRTDLFVPRTADPVRPGRITFFHNAGISPRRKGTDLLLEAFSRLDEISRLVIHSQRELATLLPGDRERIERLLASGRLELHPRAVHAPGLYHLGDVYVYPTRLEGIGLTVPEALSCGLPVIVPDSPPMVEFVDDEVARTVEVERYLPRRDGYYWPQCLVSVDSLEAQMRWFCAEAGRIGELKRAARRHAERKLDWQRNGAELGAILGRAERLGGETRRAARRAALDLERRRVDLRLFYPRTSRWMFRAADLLQPLASRYSGRGAGPGRFRE